MAKPKRNLIAEGLDKIKGFESLRLYAYPDPASPLAKQTKRYKPKWGYVPARALLEQLSQRDPSLKKLSGKPWTCGYGSTKGVTIDTIWSHQESLVHLDDDLDDAQIAVERLVKVPLTDHQYAALVSLVFNIGSGNFASSTLLKRLNEKKYLEAADRFEDWIKARNQETGKLEVLNGLKTRRAVEKALFLRGAFVESNTSMPVEVTPDEEKPVTKDPNVAIPTVTATGATLAALAEAAKEIEPLAAYSDTMRTVFIVLTVIGVFISLALGMKKRKDARTDRKEREKAG